MNRFFVVPFLVLKMNRPILFEHIDWKDRIKFYNNSHISVKVFFFCKHRPPRVHSNHEYSFMQKRFPRHIYIHVLHSPNSNKTDNEHILTPHAAQYKTGHREKYKTLRKSAKMIFLFEVFAFGSIFFFNFFD